MRERPIGVFDSGLGGLTVVQSLTDLLPQEDIIYLGDTARYPYGERSAPDVRRFAIAIAGDLVARGIKLLVVACNSATVAALDTLRERLSIPVVGVVEPALRAAASVSRSRRVMVIGTRLTAASGAYEAAAARLELDISVSTHACPGFVELVEDGRTDDPTTFAAVHRRLAPMLSARVDTLVLGCTHFPLLARPILEVVGRHTTLVSSADETAFDVRELLVTTGWLRAQGPAPRSGRITALTTGDPERFAQLAENFLGDRPASVEQHRVAGLDPVVGSAHQAPSPLAAHAIGAHGMRR